MVARTVSSVNFANPGSPEPKIVKPRFVKMDAWRALTLLSSPSFAASARTAGFYAVYVPVGGIGEKRVSCLSLQCEGKPSIFVLDPHNPLDRPTLQVGPISVAYEFSSIDSGGMWIITPPSGKDRIFFTRKDSGISFGTSLTQALALFRQHFGTPSSITSIDAGIFGMLCQSGATPSHPVRSTQAGESGAAAALAGSSSQ
jgi:hypothetical protein